MDNGSDFLQLCRLCLVKDDVNISIFEEQGDIREILQKISSCLPVKVSRDDKLPKRICDGCSYKLDMVYEFWNTTANAEKQLLIWLGEAEMKSKMTESTISAVSHQLKPAETVVKQETIDPSDIHTEENDDDKTYMFQQKFSSEEAGPSATAISNEEPPPKRARRTAAVKAQIAMDPESDDDEDSGEPITKVEDESEESEGEDNEPSYADVPSTSADDQPGPSGVGKDGADAPSAKRSEKPKGVKTLQTFKQLKAKYSLKECRIVVTDILLNKSLKFVGNTVILPNEGRKKYTCYICWKKFLNHKDLCKHKDEDHVDEDDIPEKTPQKIASTITPKINSSPAKKNTNNQTDEPVVDLSLSPLHKCQTCHVHFDSIEAVKKHPANKCRFLCGVCDRTYNTVYAFTVHILQHKINIFKTKPVTARPLHKCSLCSESFEEYFQLKTHEVLMHTTSSEKRTNDQTKDVNGSDELCCELCFDMFSTQKELKDHMEFHKQLNDGSDDETIEDDTVDLEDDDKDLEDEDKDLEDEDKDLEDEDTDLEDEDKDLEDEDKDLEDEEEDLEEEDEDLEEEDEDLEDIPDPEVESLHTSVTIPNDETIKDEVEEQLDESQADADEPVTQSSFSREDIVESTSQDTEGASEQIEEEGYEPLKSNKDIPVDHFKCKKCDRIYMSLDEYKDHIKNNKCTIVKRCKLCPKTFSKNSELYSHIYGNHRHLATCKFCFESFYKSKKLDEHKLLYHFKTFKNLCKICLQCFASYQEFNTHLQEEHLNL